MELSARPSSLAGARIAVIGGSISGLLAARVFWERGADITLIERDEIDKIAPSRRGTPHSIQPHGLLARGLGVLESLFPGFTDVLREQGASSGDIGTEIVVYANRRRLLGTTLGVDGLGVSRAAIEAEMRRHVAALSNVTMLYGVSVEAPVHGAGRVTGIRFRRRASGENAAAEETMPADLVVDCTGRTSRAASWLAEWGYDAPREERVTVGITYTSGYFERAPNDMDEIRATIGTATPALPKPSVAIPQEADPPGRLRWVVGVGAYPGDDVEPTVAGLHRRALEIGNAEIARITESRTPIGPVRRYGFPHSVRRQYERLRNFPKGFLPMGDSIASFNPVYGQGMTVACREALALRQALEGGLDGLAQRFLPAAAKLVNEAWDISVSGDLALPSVEGARSLRVRMVNAYVGRVIEAATADPVVAARFVRVMHMLDRPETLFAPPVLRRVLLPWPRRAAEVAPTPDGAIAA